MSSREHVVLSGWSRDAAQRSWPDAAMVLEVSDEAALARALDLAADGAQVVAIVPSQGPLGDAALDGLRRLGGVRIGPPASADTDEPLPEAAAAILGLLLAGSTLREAASQLGLSTRTADRRLAQAREVLGVATTAEAVMAYAARLRGSTPSPRRGSEGVPLVGREAEIAQLRDALAADVPVLVVGEGGIGKSRLLQEAAEGVGRLLYRGGGVSALRWRQYWPLARAVGKPELTGDVEAVASEVEAIVGPDLLVVDDVHLADAGTLAVLAALSPRIGVLAAARPATADDPAGAVGLLTGSGFTSVALGPLPEDVAARLATSLAPALTPPEVEAVVSGAGGLPLLVEFLCHGDETATRGRGLVPAVESLSVAGRASALRLALASRPLPPDETTPELLAAGVASRWDDGVRIRHALVADALVAVADPSQLAAAHGDLAAQATDAGTAARHWWAAGETARAYDAALAAASATSTAGERGEHLRLAALAAPEPERLTLALEAAAALSMSGRHSDVLSLLDDVAGAGSDVPGRAAELRARALWHLGDAPGARATARAGLARVEGSGGADEAALLTESVRCEALSLGPMAEHEAMLRRAMDVATAAGSGTAAILNTQAIVAYLARGEGIDEWTRGIAAAAAEGDLDVLMRCSNNVISWHESSGDPEEGLRLAYEMADTAQRHGLGEWRAQFLAMAGNVLMHRGRFAEALATLEAAEAAAVDVRTRAQSRLARASMLTDLGLFEAAQALVGPVPDSGIDDEKLDNETRYQLAVLALYTGRPRVARDLLAGQRPDPAWADAWFALTVDAWAAYELDLDVPPPPDEVPMPIVRGMQRELAGLHLLGRDPATAAVWFDEAVAVGRGWSYAPSVRAQWAAGEARRLAGAPDAVDTLLAAEEEARRAGMEPILVRIRRSLRLAGVRRAAPRGLDRSGLVTQRERAVLELVGQGATDAEIARRLGVGRPTVRRLIDSARAKLGAADRVSAAAALPPLPARPP